MPLAKQINLGENQILAIWEITETHAELLIRLKHNYHEAHKEKRAQQANALHWLASRCLIQEIFPHQTLALTKNEFNQPSLWVNEEPWFISITHSANMAGILVSKSEAIGIDLEKIDTRINRVCKKFMNEAEMTFAGQENQITEKTLIWSAKETLFKLYGQKELDFKLHLLIEPFQINENKGVFYGNICKTLPSIRQIICFELLENIVLTYTLQSHE
jgi:phosphopantetheinyl transferase